MREKDGLISLSVQIIILGETGPVEPTAGVDVGPSVAKDCPSANL